MTGKAIKELRMSRQMTQQQLADILGVDRSSIGKYEAGCMPSGEIALRMAEYFGVSVDCLYDRDTAENAADDEAQLIGMFRRLSGLPEDQRREIIRHIGDTIDMYLRAAGRL